MTANQAKRPGRPKIQDEFTALKVSRQRKEQLRRIRDGQCQQGGCRNAISSASNCYCEECLTAYRERYIPNVRRQSRNSRPKYDMGFLPLTIGEYRTRRGHHVFVTKLRGPRRSHAEGHILTPFRRWPQRHTWAVQTGKLLRHQYNDIDPIDIIATWSH